MKAKVVNVVIDANDPVRVAAFWTEALGYIEEPPEEEGWVLITDPTGEGPSLYFQPVPEHKVVKDRLHLDLISDLSMAEQVERLQGLGATSIVERGHDTWRWTIMEDLEGNEFCVAEPVVEADGTQR